MSLINDYLKKTEHQSKGTTQAGDLPPVLKTTGKRSGSSLVYLRIITVVLLVFIVGAGIYLYRLPGTIQEDLKPGKKISSFNHKNQGMLYSTTVHVYESVSI